MLGFVIGGLSLIGLVKVLRAGRGYGACGGGSWRGHGWHGGHGWRGGHGWQGGHGWHGGESEARGGGFWLRGLFSKLDTTPGQEKVIKEAFGEVKAAVESAGGELDQSRRDIASAVRSGTVDETALGALFARHDEKLRDVQKAFVTALGKVNAALDEDQRKRLADMIDRDGRGFGRGFGGPYRGGAWA